MDPTAKFRGRPPKFPGWLVVGAVVAVLGFAGFLRLGPAGSSWTVDDAGKTAVLERMLRSGGPWLEYPGRERDPELRFFPLPLRGSERYATVLADGRILSQYTTPFLLLAAPLAALAGHAGRALLPAIAGGACVVLAGALARRRGASTQAALVAAGIAALATPLLFYSSVFWEHTLAAALATGALLLLAESARERPLGAGVLMGCATLLREEMLLFAVAGAIAMAIAGRARRSIARYVLGCSFGFAALLAWNLTVAGTPWGVHVDANRPAFAAHVGRAIASLLLDPGFARIPLLVPAAALALLATSLSPALLRAPRAARAVQLASLAALAAISALAFVEFPGGEDRALALIHSNSMLVAAPWALVALFPIRRQNVPHLACLLFVTLFVLLVPERSITGIHPGPRMLLPIFPTLAAGLAPRLLSAGDRLGRALLGFLLLVGMLGSVRALELLHDKRAASGHIAGALAADPRRIVVTDLFWLPIELGPLLKDKEFHLVSNSADLGTLAARCAAAGEHEILYVTSPGAIRNRPPLATTANPGFPHFSVELHVFRP